MIGVNLHPRLASGAFARRATAAAPQEPARRAEGMLPHDEPPMTSRQ
jgi:hypothetical protein